MHIIGHCGNVHIALLIYGKALQRQNKNRGSYD